MKRAAHFFAILTLILHGKNALAQGLVLFGNASTLGWADPTVDRYVRWGTGNDPPYPPAGSPVASNYGSINLSSLRAALYYAASTDFDPNFTGYLPASGGPTTLKHST